MEFYHRGLLLSSPSPSSQALDSSSHNLYTPTSIDTNLVLILAAILCLLICTLAINSMAKCLIHLLAMESPQEASARLANTGLNKDAMKALPKVVYGRPVMGMETSHECPICLAEFAAGETGKPSELVIKALLKGEEKADMEMQEACNEELPSVGSSSSSSCSSD